MEWVKNPAHLPLWERLRHIAMRHEEVLDLHTDEPGYYKLVKFQTKSQFTPFLAICIQRRHVSLYLNSLYHNLHLMDDVPEILTQRKSGKCTFHFRSEDDEAIEHVAALLDSCLVEWLDDSVIC